MAATTKVPLGAPTTNRKWYLDVNTGTDAIPAWTGVFGVQEFKPLNSPTVQDSSDFDGEGFKSSAVTALEWGIELKVARKVQASTPTSYDPGQEKLRAVSNVVGAGNRVGVRYYEMEPGGPRVEAWQGFASVEWTEDGGDMTALDTVTVKLYGQGKRTAIEHPDAGGGGG